jgi:hypothetical protein
MTSSTTAAAVGHLSLTDRQANLEILRDTVSDLPDYWRKKS